MRRALAAAAGIALVGCGGNSPFDTTVSGPHAQLFDRSERARQGEIGHSVTATFILPEGYRHMSLNWTYRCPLSDASHWNGLDVRVDLWNAAIDPPGQPHRETLKLASSPADTSGSRSFDLVPDDPNVRVRITPRDAGCTWTVIGYAT